MEQEAFPLFGAGSEYGREAREAARRCVCLLLCVCVCVCMPAALCVCVCVCACCSVYVSVSVCLLPGSFLLSVFHNHPLHRSQYTACNVADLHAPDALVCPTGLGHGGCEQAKVPTTH